MPIGKTLVQLLDAVAIWYRPLTLRQVGEKLGMSERSAHRYMKELEAMGFVFERRLKNGQGPQYHINAWPEKLKHAFTKTHCDG